MNKVDSEGAKCEKAQGCESEGENERLAKRRWVGIRVVGRAGGLYKDKKVGGAAGFLGSAKKKTRLLAICHRDILMAGVV